MEKTRKMKLMGRWSFVTGGTIALFWTIWYLVAGEVPTVHSLKITENWTLEFPFEVSRWWDVLIGPIWSIFLILLFTNKEIIENNEPPPSLIFGLAIGLMAIPITGVKIGLVAVLAFTLFFGLVIGVVAGVIASVDSSLSVSLSDDKNAALGAGLSAGLVTALGAGLGAGLVICLVFGVGAVLAFGVVTSLIILTRALIALFIFIVSRNCWKVIGNWLLARD